MSYYKVNMFQPAQSATIWFSNMCERELRCWKGILNWVAESGCWTGLVVKGDTMPDSSQIDQRITEELLRSKQEAFKFFIQGLPPMHSV